MPKAQETTLEASGRLGRGTSSLLAGWWLRDGVDPGHRTCRPEAEVLFRHAFDFSLFVAQDATPEKQQNKYTVKLKKKLHSRFLLRQEMKEKEAALLLEQQKLVCESGLK